MNKVKMLVLAVLAAATVGVGSLSAAPSGPATTAKKLPGRASLPQVTVVRGMTRNIEG
jgi:hypothetical protein